MFSVYACDVFSVPIEINGYLLSFGFHSNENGVQYLEMNMSRQCTIGYGKVAYYVHAAKLSIRIS